MTTIDNLPNEAIIHIMSYLTLKNRKSTRLTCKRWNEISYDVRLIKNDSCRLYVEEYPNPHLERPPPDLNAVSSIWRQVNFTILRNPPSIIQSPYWTNHGSTVRSLTLVKYDAKNPSIALLLNSCSNLEALNLDVNYDTDNDNPYPAPITEVSLKKLKDLQFRRFPFVDGFGLVDAILNGSPNVQRLSMSSVLLHHSDWDKILAFIERRRNTLVELYFEEVRLFPDDLQFEEFLKVVGDGLTRLHLMNQRIITDSSLREIARKLKGLQRLSIFSYSPGLSPEVVAQMLHSLPKLTDISFGKTNLSGGNFSMSEAFSSLQFLTRLDLSCSSFSRDYVIQAFGQESKSHPSLLHLVLDGLEIDCDVLCAICPNLTNLKRLSLSGCGLIKNRGFRAICQYNEELQSLVLASCSQITDDALKSLSLSELVFLDIDYRKLSAGEVLGLFERCRRLLEVYGVGASCFDANVRRIIEARKVLRPYGLAYIDKGFWQN